MIYLDNAATTKVSYEVWEEMIPFLTDKYGNSASIHSLGREAATAVEEARSRVAGLINCSPDQIIFTSGGSESNSMVFSGITDYLLKENKKHIVISNVEHDSVVKFVLPMFEHFNVTAVPVGRSGRVAIGDVDEAIKDDTGLVSIMYVNNETGAVNPVTSIGKMCSHRNVLFHTDCVQAIGSYKVDVNEIGCDFLSISGHKIHAPKGTGALYVKDKTILEPIIRGGIGQEFGLRGGTENVAGIVGFGKACELVNQHFYDDVEKIRGLKGRFIKRLKGMLIKYNTEDILHINGSPDHGKILNLRFDGIDGQTLLLMLDSENICVSAGSACHSSSSEPSRVLRAMGLTESEARSSIRVSFSTMLAPDDVLVAADTIAKCVDILKCGDFTE